MSPEHETQELGSGSTEAGTGHTARIAEGWQRRFVVDQHRVVEMVRLYQALGYETAVDPVQPEEVPAQGPSGESAAERPDPRCDTCRLVTLRWLHVIYTRTPRPRAD